MIPACSKGFAAAIACIAAAWSGNAIAQAGSLNLEFNSIADTTEGCLMTLMVNNSSTQSFSQLAYDVYLFDETGAVVDRLLLDFGRLRENRTRIVQFQLERACGRISRLHINGAPECVLENGQSSEFCMDGVIASSRTEIQFGL